MEPFPVSRRGASVQRRFPQGFELAQILNTYVPNLVFLDLSDWNGALLTANNIRTHSDRTPIIGFGGGWQPGRDTECAAAGVTEVLVSPVTLKKFEDSVERAIQKMNG